MRNCEIASRTSERESNVAFEKRSRCHDIEVQKACFLPARDVRERYRVSDMTIWRWSKDMSLNFPKPIYIGRNRYWDVAKLEAWEAERAANS